jgi:putative membrane protein
MKRLLSLISLLMIGAFGLGFAALNSTQVTIRYYLGELNAPLSLALVIALVAGALLGILASLGLVLSQRVELTALRKRVGICEREVQNLREIPFKE